MGRKKSQDFDIITCKVKEFRLKKGWSQKELAANLDMRRQAVYDIESGRYLPNTAIALRLARLFNCRVEDLFVEQHLLDNEPVHVITGENEPSTRLALGRVRDRLVGMPVGGTKSILFGLQPADGLLNPDKKSACLFSPPERLDKTIFLMGCDPAFEILANHVIHLAPEARVHCHFATSHLALNKLAEGMTHMAGTHLHNEGKEESNVVVAGQKLKRYALPRFGILDYGGRVDSGQGQPVCHPDSG